MRKRAGSKERRRTPGEAQADARYWTWRLVAAMAALVGLSWLDGVGLSWLDGVGLSWLEEVGLPVVFSVGGALSLAAGIGHGLTGFRRQRVSARYPAVIHCCESSGEGGWAGVVSVTVAEGHVVRYPLTCWASHPRKRRPSPVMLQRADGRLLQPGESTTVAVRAILATWVATYSGAGFLMAFGIAAIWVGTNA
jgi:hypothetical protein